MKCTTKQKKVFNSLLDSYSGDHLPHYESILQRVLTAPYSHAYKAYGAKEQEASIEAKVGYKTLRKEAGDWSGGVQAVIQDSPVEISTDYYYDKDGSDKNRVRRLALDKQVLAEYMEAGFTEASVRWRREDGGWKETKAGRRKGRPMGSTLQQDAIKACRGEVTIRESNFQDALALCKRMLKSEAEIEKGLAVAAALQNLQEQTVRVTEGRRTVYVAYTPLSTGRVGTPGAGLQHIPRYFKDLLLSEVYIDGVWEDTQNFDAPSCHDVILEFLFDKYNVDPPEYPDKREVARREGFDLRLLKKVIHSIKQSGKRQLPASVPAMFGMTQNGCDVAGYVHDLCKSRADNIRRESYSSAKDYYDARDSRYADVIIALQQCYADVERAVAELATAFDGRQSEHPQGKPLGEGKKPIAWLLQGHEAAFVLRAGLELDGVVLLDHDGLLTTASPEEVKEAVATVNREVECTQDLVKKPLYGEDDVPFSKEDPLNDGAAPKLHSRDPRKEKQPEAKGPTEARQKAEQTAQKQAVTERAFGPKHIDEDLQSLQQAAERLTVGTAADWLELYYVLERLAPEPTPLSVAEIRRELSPGSPYREQPITKAADGTYISCRGIGTRRWSTSAPETSRRRHAPVLV